MIDVTLHQLRMLREVAVRDTISAAADALGYTPSAVSQRLAALEKTLGVEVLERVGRNVRLTDAGRELVRHAEKLLAGMEEAQTAIEQVHDRVTGTFEIALSESVAATLLPPLLGSLRRTHPDLRLRSRQLDPEFALEALNSGQIDMAFSIDYPHASQPTPAGITSVPIMKDDFYLVVPESDPATAGPVAMIDFRDRPFISSSPDLLCGRCFLSACHGEGFEPEIAHVLDDYGTTIRMVAAGEGVALISDLGLVHDLTGVRMLPLRSGLSRTIEIVCRTTSAERPALRAIRDAAVGVVDRREWLGSSRQAA